MAMVIHIGFAYSHNHMKLCDPGSNLLLTLMWKSNVKHFLPSSCGHLLVLLPHPMFILHISMRFFWPFQTFLGHAGCPKPSKMATKWARNMRSSWSQGTTGTNTFPTRFMFQAFWGIWGTSIGSGSRLEKNNNLSHFGPLFAGHAHAKTWLNGHLAGTNRV